MHFKEKLMYTIIIIVYYYAMLLLLIVQHIPYQTEFECQHVTYQVYKGMQNILSLSVWLHLT